ncbi:hypothetical protein MFFC18_39180 [Mariniblastus fucicola]|uniref:Uncharacterized protein n=1 Tax=Mariniblastus fucicola TaxID=980251 RepID=A0A5B9PGY1_9BACT|nr:hypothetical protein MFFC18_39180 [Mariniblastus fucicola]
MQVHHQIFQSSYRFWNDLCNEAAQFASQIPPELLINITHSCDHQKGVVVVWYHWPTNEKPI